MPPVSPTKGGLLSALVGGFDGRVGRGGSRRLGGVGRRVARSGGGDVHGQTELGHVVEVDRAAVGRLLRRRAVALGQHLALHPLDRQGEAAPLGVDLEDLDLHVVARLDDLARVLDVVLGELGDVHEALDALEDLDEGPERDDLGDLPLELVADVVGVDHALPRVLLGLLEAQGDALAVAVDVEHLDLHRVADREDLGRVVDVRPRQLGDVDEAVDSVEADKRAEVDDVQDLALDDEPRLQPVEDLLALLLALLLQDRAAAQDDVVARAVELDDLRLDLRAHVLVEVGHAADVDQRRGQEAAHAEVDDQATLDHLDDGALDGLAALRRRLDAPPCLLEARALLGHDEAAVLVLLGEDQRIDLLAELDLVGRVAVLADRQLVGGDDPLALVADVDEDLVVVDAHDASGDDVALLERREGRVVVGDDLAVDLQQQAVGAFDDLGLGSRDGGLGHVAEQVSAVAPPRMSGLIPVRATKRGSERTPLSGEFDVLICGASFAGLAVARELRDTGARVLIVVRYEVGERQTSACAAPTDWLRNLGLEAS